MNRLDEILVHKRREVEQRRLELDLTQLRARMMPHTDPRSFSQALRQKDAMALIAEIKWASPSAGILRKDFDPSALAQAYERGGAHALSVLTDERFFHGKLKDLLQARSATSIPCLRKDFVIDEYQIWEGRLANADAILLIVAALKREELARFIQITTETGMDALVEAHDERELDIALEVGANIVGINNRNLQTFEVDLAVTERLAPKIPRDRMIVSESGIRTAVDIRRLRACGVHAILVGESLMRQTDIESATRKLMASQEAL